MNTTVKDLLVNKLTANGFIYYPSMKRLMIKKEVSNVSDLIIIEIENEKSCRVYSNHSDFSLNTQDCTLDRNFSYNADQILSFVDSILHKENIQAAA